MLWPDTQVGFEILVISWEMTVNKRRLYIIGRVYDQHFVLDDHFIMRYFHGIFSERIHSERIILKLTIFMDFFWKGKVCSELLQKCLVGKS